MAKHTSEIELDFTEAAKQMTHRFGDVFDKKHFQAAFAKQLARIGQDFANVVKYKYLTNNPIHVRTGNLRNSFGNRLSPYGVFVMSPHKLGVGLTLRIGTTLKYAPILEEGADIYPKKANGALAIPIGDALTPSGVPRFTWRQRGDIPSQYPDLFLIRGRNDTAFLVRKVGDQIRPMFILKKRVHIEGRHFLRRAAEQFQPFMEQKLLTAIEEYLS